MIKVDFVYLATITVETYEVLIVRRAGSLSRVWCASCARPVAIISLDDASRSGLSVEAIHHQVKSGRIHLIETPGGSALICLNSLIQT